MLSAEGFIKGDSIKEVFLRSQASKTCGKAEGS